MPSSSKGSPDRRTVIGFSLFFTYSSADFVFRNVPHPLPDAAVPFACGALAGSAQAIISSPLDNVRMLLSRRAEGAKFIWAKIMQEALFPAFLVGQPPSESKSRFGQLRHLTRWASRGWSLYGLSLTRDALGFGAFFAVFEAGRKVAKRTGNRIDEALASKTWPTWLTGKTEEEKKSRGWIGRTAQAFVLVAGGTLAGLCYGVIGRPFDVARREIWQGRMNWAEKEGLVDAKAAAPAEAPAPPRNRFERIFGSSFLKRRAPQPKLPELPSARSLIREAIRRDGLRVFFISPTRAVTSRIDPHPALGGASVFTPGGKPRSSTPRGLGSSIVRFFSVVPPYALAFLAYAIASGDLST